MDNKSKEFLALQKKWYAKLRKEGFDDIEQDEDHLKLWSSHFFKVRFNATLFEAKEEYYRLAGQFLEQYEFHNRFEKLVWELHTDGISVRNIAKKLKSKGYKTHKNAVHKVVKDLVKVMMEQNGIR